MIAKLLALDRDTIIAKNLGYPMIISKFLRMKCIRSLITNYLDLAIKLMITIKICARKDLSLKIRRMVYSDKMVKILIKRVD